MIYDSNLAMPCPATPRPAMPCPALPRLATPRQATPCLATPCGNSFRLLTIKAKKIKKIKTFFAM
jgi:hypothetical protein